MFYNDVYEVDLPPNHRFPMNKYRQTRELVQKWITEKQQRQQVNFERHGGMNSLLQCEFRVSPLASVEELETTHCPMYIRRYLMGEMTKEEQRNVGFPWSEQGVRRSLSSVGGTLAAAINVVERNIQMGLSTQEKKDEQHSRQDHSSLLLRHRRGGGNIHHHWGAHIAGGTHHAFYDRGEGFSVFSDMAVAANVVLQRYPDHVQRILFFDLDVHQGNGNAVLFQHNPHVFTFSIHCKANYFSKKETSDLDIELPSGCGDQTYLMTLNYWLKQFLRGDAEQFDLVFYQAGVDVLADDRLGNMDLTMDGLHKRNQMVYEFCHKLGVPLVICMGGGYPQGKDWTPIVNAHANVYFQAYNYLLHLGQNDSTSYITSKQTEHPKQPS